MEIRLNSAKRVASLHMYPLKYFFNYPQDLSKTIFIFFFFLLVVLVAPLSLSFLLSLSYLETCSMVPFPKLTPQFPPPPLLVEICFLVSGWTM